MLKVHLAWEFNKITIPSTSTLLIQIGLTGLTIDNSNPRRFFPDIQAFRFSSSFPQPRPTIAIQQAMELIWNENYIAAFDTFPARRKTFL
jgi:hypothetical protein